MSKAMDVRSCLRATLLALTTLSVLSWLPHVYSCLRAFFLESLPSLASAAVAPRCLFVFSNIIVVFLISESKLSRNNKKKKTDAAAPTNTAVVHGAAARGQQEEEDLVVVVREALQMLPTIAGETELAAEEEEEEGHNKVTTVEDHQEVLQVASEAGQAVQVDHRYCEEEEEVISLSDLHYADELKGGDQLDMVVLREEAATGAGDLELEQDGEELERYLPPADELNRRVEDFIARFNMERQLEARMLVCCC